MNDPLKICLFLLHLLLSIGVVVCLAFIKGVSWVWAFVLAGLLFDLIFIPWNLWATISETWDAKIVTPSRELAFVVLEICLFAASGALAIVRIGYTTVCYQGQCVRVKNICVGGACTLFRGAQAIIWINVFVLLVTLVVTGLKWKNARK